MAKLKDVLFMPDAIDTVIEFYDFHNNIFGRQMFINLIEEEYQLGLVFDNKNHFIQLPLDKLISDFQFFLDRIGWVVIKDTGEVLEVVPENGIYVKRKHSKIVFDDDYINITGYSPHPDQIHILVAKAKKKSLLNFKKFRKAIDELLKEYKLITASCAKSPDKLIGKENDWRFRKESNSNRLRVFWEKVGFKSIAKDNYKMYIARET